MSRALHCTVCTCWIEKWGPDIASGGEPFDYDRDGEGPYCVRCWRWQEKIDKLAEKVSRLERIAERERIHRHPESFS